MLLAFSLLFWVQTILAQGTTGNQYIPGETDYTLPSPVSQAYQRFRGFSPEYATGAVNVSIPLLTLESDKFTLPFTLGYQSNGIKTTDPFFPLGYGWLLHPGLRITRTVLGNPDDTAPGRIYPYVPSADACFFRKLSGTGANSDAMYDVFTLLLPQEQADFLVKSEDGGKNWTTITATDTYRIEPLTENPFNYRFCGFKVTDGNGIIYYFGEENSYSASSPFLEQSMAGGSWQTTTYLLNRVLLPGNKEISFTWKSVADEVPRFENYYVHIDGFVQYFSPENYASVYYQPWDYGEGKYEYMADNASIAGSLLESVTFPDAHVDLLYAGNNLKSLTAYDHQNRKIKGVSFNISDKLLRSVTIDGTENYSFTYNPIHFENSYDCDFWGYYNGAGNPPYLCYPSYVFHEMGKTTTTTISGADRHPNPRYMQANMLVQVTYPTGGYTHFEYEPHVYKLPGVSDQTVQGGGLRVKSVTNSTGGNAGDERSAVTTYAYGINECGHGSCSVHIDEEAFVSEVFMARTTLDNIFSYRQQTLHGHHQYAVYLLFNLPVWYPAVTEHHPDGSRTTYEYDYSPDAPDENRDAFLPDLFPYFYSREHGLLAGKEYYHLFDKSPLLTRRGIYDARGKQIYTEQNYYQACKSSPGGLQNISYRQAYAELEHQTYECYPYAGFDYITGAIRAEKKMLCKQVVTMNGVTVTKEILRNSAGLPIRTQTVQGDGTLTEERIWYAQENLSELTEEQQDGAAVLRSRHCLSFPVGMSKSVNGTEVSRKAIVYRMATGPGNVPVYPVKEYYRTGNHPEELRVEYPSHDCNGRPVEIAVDGVHTVYLWGYAGHYPVTRIENATYKEVASCLGESVLKGIATAPILTDAYAKALDGLRGSLPEALVTTYTYQPFIGMLSETNPAGQSIYYSYDGAGRLAEKYRMVSGGDGTQAKEVIESYEYKYKED